MVSRFIVQVPAISIGAMLPMESVRHLAAEKAADSFLQSPAIDWLGKTRRLRDVLDQAGRTHEVEFAVRQLFLALVSERLSYRKYMEQMRYDPKSISEDVKRAVDYYHHVFKRSPELNGLGLGDGKMLLPRLSAQMEQYLAREQPKTVIPSNDR